MPGLNRVELIGYLGKDPESRYTPTGKQVTTFRVAVSRRWHNAEGEQLERTEWFNIETWGRQAEAAQEYLRKGRLVYVEGRLQTDRYEQEGETRYFTKVVARSFQNLDRRPEDVAPEEPEADEEEFPF